MSKTNEQYEGVKELREYSFIAYAMERFFWILMYLSPVDWFLSSKMELQEKFDRGDNAIKEKLTKKRGKEIELYMCICILAEILILLLVNIVLRDYRLIKYLLLIPIAVRLLDIFQTNVNISVFAHLRTRKPHGRQYIATPVRLLVLVAINYLEIILCFGIIYSVFISNIQCHTHWADALYFSVITQLTIGYGDLRPTEFLRLAVCVQGMLGLLFTVLIISRIINLVPQPTSIAGGRDNTQE